MGYVEEHLGKYHWMNVPVHIKCRHARALVYVLISLELNGKRDENDHIIMTAMNIDTDTSFV